MRIPETRHSFFSFQISPWLFVFLIAALGCFYLLNIRPGHDWGDDFAAYIHHAKNIATGHPYADIKFILNPFQWIAPRTYPPVFPFFLSFVYKFFGLNLFAMKALVILFWTGALGLLYLFLRTRLSPIMLFLLILIVGLHPFLVFFLNNILSEVPFLFFTLLSLYFAEYLYSRKLDQKENTLFFCALGALMYLVYATRVVGIVLIPAIVVYDVFKYKRLHKETLFAILVFCFFAGLQRVFGFGGAGQFSLFDFSFAVMPERIMFYLDTFYFLNTNEFEKFLFLIKIYLGIVGFYVAVRRGLSLGEFFIAAYLFVIFIYVPRCSVFDSIRYFIPVIPFYFYYIFLGAKKIVGVVHQKMSRAILAGFFIVIISMHATAVMALNSQKGLDFTGVLKQEAVDLFDYINKNTSPNDVLVFAKPRAITLFTGRPASVYHTPKNKQALWDYFKKIKARYIVLWRQKEPYLDEVVKIYSGRVEKVYTNKNFDVYKILTF